MAAGRFDRDTRRAGALLDPAHGRLDETALVDDSATIATGSTRRAPGAGNGGHDVWPRIRTDDNRRALIEYLKTL